MKAALNKTCKEDRVQRKPVVGYEGHYEVTADGRVWSMPRVITRGHILQPIRGRWLKPCKDNQNRRSVNLQVGGRSRTFRVHVLVATAFLGPRPEGFHIDHIDRDASNNRLSNLRYVTQSVNLHNTSARGYCWDKDRGCYRAYLKVDWKLHYLGLHDTAEEARAAHVAAKKLHGVFTP